MVDPGQGKAYMPPSIPHCMAQINTTFSNTCCHPFPAPPPISVSSICFKRQILSSMISKVVSRIMKHHRLLSRASISRCNLSRISHHYLTPKINILSGIDYWREKSIFTINFAFLWNIWLLFAGWRQMDNRCLNMYMYLVL